MNDNQILVLHSRWVYNFMAIILEAQVFFIPPPPPTFMHSFQQQKKKKKKKKKQIFVIFIAYVLLETVIEKALCKLVCEMNIEAFIPNLGQPLLD